MMWACAGEQGMAICPLIGADSLPQVDEMASLYPETNVVIDHFARIGGDGMFRDSDLKLLTGLAKFPKVHVKVSAFYFLGEKKPPYRDLIPMIRRVYDAYGANRLMWGSDCPYQLGGENTYPASVELVQKGLDFLSEQERKSLLKTTAERVFFASA